MSLFKNLSVAIAAPAFIAFETVGIMAWSSPSKAKKTIPKSQLYAQGSPSTATIAVSVDWNAVRERTTGLKFGLNVYQGFMPQNFNNSAYSSNIAYMSPGLIRFHNAGSLDDSINADGLINTAHRTWDADKITSALLSSFNAFGNNQPQRMINIPTWPTWMDANQDGFLDTNQFDNYARLCAALVKIVNKDNHFGVKYWEVTNEKDDQYFTQFHTNAGWGGLINTRRPDRLNELITIYNKVAVAMKRADPTIKVGGPAIARADLQPFYVPFIRGTVRNLDFFTYHFYATGSASTSDSNVYNSTQAIANYTKSIVQALKNASPNRHIPAMLDEYNISWTWTTYDPRMSNNKGAVFDALSIVKAIENGASATLAWNEKDDIYGKTSNQNQLRPSAHLFHLLNNLLVGYRVRTTTSDSNVVVPFAVNSSAAGHKSYLIINRSNSPKRIRTNFNGWTPAQETLNKYEVSALGYRYTTIQWNSISSRNFLVPANSVTLLKFTD